MKDVIDTATVLTERFYIENNDKFTVKQIADDDCVIFESNFKTEAEARIVFLARIVQFVACFNTSEEQEISQVLEQISKAV